MAVFSNTVVVQKEVGLGYTLEKGTWTDANSAGAGTITAATQTAGSPTMAAFEIKAWSFTSNGDYAVIPTVSGLAANQIGIVCTAGDAGTYTLICKVK
jgi:hypothetical protein